MPSHIHSAVPHQLLSPLEEKSRRMNQMTVIVRNTHQARRNHLVQYHARRRLTMSSSRALGSSVPKRLGQGMKRRRTMSMKPRNAITAMNVQKSAQPHETPTWFFSQRNTTGLVRTATAVAVLINRRHWRVSSFVASPEGSPTRPSPDAIVIR